MGPEFSRRSLLVGGAVVLPAAFAAIMPRKCAAAQPADALAPEMFGAKGDGVTNDSAALARLAAAVNAAGGGSVSFAAGKTYIVGGQSLSDTPRSVFAFEPHTILHLTGCTRPLTIRGNGARLKCAPVLRYGTFDRSGRRTDNPGRYTGRGQAASPYRHMIAIERCSAPVEVSGFELDGNLGALIIGGTYGDVGRQLPASGLALLENSGSETVHDIYTHHHALDGLYIDGLSEPIAGVVRQVTNVRSEYNGRQGCSVVGGRGYRFGSCRFNRTGKGGLFSPPGAGFDIEAEGGKTNRDLHFIDCEFADNSGVGMVADSGPSEGALFERCKFIGTTAWAAWPRKPRFRFHDCTFVGPIVQTYRDEDPERAAQFHSCGFFDDPRLSRPGRCTRENSAHLSPISARVTSTSCFRTAGSIWSGHCSFPGAGMRSIPTAECGSHRRGSPIRAGPISAEMCLLGISIWAAR